MSQPRGIFFVIPSDRPDYAISVPNGSSGPNHELFEEPFTGGKKQQWIISDGVISNVKSNLVWAAHKYRLWQKVFRVTDTEQRFEYKNSCFHVQKSRVLMGGWKSMLEETNHRLKIYIWDGSMVPGIGTAYILKPVT
jgi:hypothetical protein